MFSTLLIILQGLNFVLPQYFMKLHLAVFQWVSNRFSLRWLMGGIFLKFFKSKKNLILVIMPKNTPKIGFFFGFYYFPLVCSFFGFNLALYLSLTFWEHSKRMSDFQTLPSFMKNKLCIILS